jgi:2-C-methyl-D-erythritol 2,4-cyclodiphosphate synthase
MIVGGVRLPDPPPGAWREGVGGPVGPVGHSDGDVLYHAVTDALLGAIAAPDIGQLFPDTDAKHEGRNSADFLAEAVRQVRAAGYTVANLDATVILERPKLSPHKPAIRANLATLLGVAPEAVNIKGKTHEKVDAVGEGRAIEAHAVVLLSRMG